MISPQDLFYKAPCYTGLANHSRDTNGLADLHTSKDRITPCLNLLHGMGLIPISLLVSTLAFMLTAGHSYGDWMKSRADR